MENNNIERKRNVTNLFNKVSSVFDSSGPRYFAYFGERLVEQAGVKEGEYVLDVASGKGASLFPSIEEVGPKGKVIGIDIADGMVNESNLEMQRRGIKNAEVRLMDAEKLEFENEMFHHILCGFGVFFFPNYKKAFSEFKRVLKDRGRFSFTTFLRKKDEKFIWFDELIQKYLPPSEEYKKDDNDPEFDTEEGVYEVLEQAGFKNIQIIREEKNFVYRDEQEWWDKLWTHGYIRVLEKIPKDKIEEFKKEVFSKLKEIKEMEGIYVTMFVAYSIGEK